MKKTLKFSGLVWSTVLSMVLTFSSCSKEQVNPAIYESVISNVQRSGCTPVTSVCLMAGQNMNAGMVHVSNDAQNVYVEYEMQNGWSLKLAHLYAGDCTSMQNPPYSHNGNPAPGQFPFHSADGMYVSNYIFTIPMSSLDSCFCVAAHAEVVRNGQQETAWACGTGFAGANWATYFNYCKQNCPPDSCNGFKTVTQGGWGAPAKGNNPGTYLNAKFASAFPTGLTSGCDFTVRLTSSTAVRNFLPQGSTPRSITMNYVNSTNKLITVLAGQIVALKLNVRFDEMDENFAPSTKKLGDQLVASGMFAGMSVKVLLAEGEKILGGCASIYTPSQINEAISKVNENYDNGADLGFLICPVN